MAIGVATRERVHVAIAAFFRGASRRPASRAGWAFPHTSIIDGPHSTLALGTDRVALHFHSVIVVGCAASKLPDYIDEAGPDALPKRGSTLLRYADRVASRIERALGIVERTSAEIGEGPWTPRTRTQNGYLFAFNTDGVRGACFELAPGNVLPLDPARIESVRKVASGFNIILDVYIRASPGDPNSAGVITVAGPRGRVRRIFDFIGCPIQ